MNHVAEKKHPYHLVDPSPWPFTASLGTLIAAIGTVFFLHEFPFGHWILSLGVGLILFTAIGWWRDVLQESNATGIYTKEVMSGLRIGMVLFIASEVLFFAAFFWAYFNSALNPVPEIGSVWPPKGIKTFDAFHLPYFNTLILLTSGTTVTWAHHALMTGNRRGLTQGLALTILLGLAFTCVQAYEYSVAGFAFKDGIYPSTFYMATGFHGAHVIIGTIFLMVCFYRSLVGEYTPKQHVGFECAAWYWHFVDVVWLFLFTSVYWWGG